MRELSKIEQAQRLIKAATGYGYGDGMTVTNIGVGYADSAADDDRIWVTGNWHNDTVWNEELRQHVGRTGTKRDTMPERLSRALELIDVECEWSDENEPCAECQRLIRTAPDSYSWTLQAVWTDDGYVCADCAAQNINSYIEDYVNDSDKAVTWADAKQMGKAGWFKWEPGNEHDYQNGWYPGQTDDPSAILAKIQAQRDNAEVVFLIDGSGQFDVAFSAWVKCVSLLERHNVQWSAKYDSPMASYLHDLSLDGTQDEETGSTDFGRWVGRFSKYLLSEDYRKFVYCQRFPTEDAARAEFSLIETAYAEWCEANDE